MLMMTYQRADQGIALRLEGRVSGPWCDELARFWEHTSPRLSFNKLAIDLRELTYADACGTEVLRHIYAQTHANLIADSAWTKHLAEEIKTGMNDATEQEVTDYKGRFRSLLDLPGKFFNKLSPETFNTLMWMGTPISYSPGEVLFREDDSQMESVYLLLDGKVKLSISTGDGNSVTYAVAKKGDILGLASAVSGLPSEMTAETIERSKIARIWRQDLSHFLLSHADAYEAVIKEVREDLLSAMDFLRTIESPECKNIEDALRKLRGTVAEASASAS
jgi:CRP-like cAMP-binding protein